MCDECLAVLYIQLRSLHAHFSVIFVFGIIKPLFEKKNKKKYGQTENTSIKKKTDDKQKNSYFRNNFWYMYVCVCVLQNDIIIIISVNIHITNTNILNNQL